MKKKVLLALVAVTLVLTLTCLAACTDYQPTLDKIQSLLEVSYSKVEIKITTKIYGVELEGNYTLTFSGNVTNIVYSYEELNELSINGGNSFKSTVSGTAVVQNGVVVAGNQAELSTAPWNFGELTFKQAYFSKIVATQYKFDADVVSAKGFFGGSSSFAGSKLHVKVFFGDEDISEMSLTYRSTKGAEVSIVYNFTV